MIPIPFLVSHGLPSWSLLRVVASATAVMPVLADMPSPAPGTYEPWIINAAATVAMLGGGFWLWNQAREAFGRKPPVDEELAEFKKRIEDQMVTHAELETRLDALANEMERKFEKALHEEFKQLNQERSRSIAGIHAKVEETATELRAEIGVVNALVREMRGEMKSFFRGGRGE
jgi:hypothetical protein